MEAKELTTEQKQEKFFRKILYLAEKSKTTRAGRLSGNKYKEIVLLLPPEIIEEIKEWADNLRVE